MYVIKGDTAVDTYGEVLSAILEFGEVVVARGYSTRELQNLCVRSMRPQEYIIWDSDDPRTDVLFSEIDTVRHGEDPEFQADEELDDRLDLDNGTFYEDIIRERISEDWDEWIELLSDDSKTRKATSLFGARPDPPCTSRVSWLIRRDESGTDRLQCYTYNRSSDMLFGYPMDVGLFGHYHHELALELDVEVGIHEHTMTSAHIYAEQFDEAKKLAEEYSA